MVKNNNLQKKQTEPIIVKNNEYEEESKCQ